MKDIIMGIILLLMILCWNAIQILRLHLKTDAWKQDRQGHLQRIQRAERLFCGLLILLLLIPACCFFQQEQVQNHNSSIFTWNY